MIVQQSGPHGRINRQLDFMTPQMESRNCNMEVIRGINLPNNGENFPCHLRRCYATNNQRKCLKHLRQQTIWSKSCALECDIGTVHTA